MKNKKNINKILYLASALLAVLCCVLLAAIIDSKSISTFADSSDETSVEDSITEGESTSETTTKEKETENKETTSEKQDPTESSTKPKHEGEGKFVYFTFDDGPSYVTDEILDILDRYEIKATFFVIHHKGSEDRLREIHRRGHTIGLHSYTHDYSKIYTSTDAFFEDLQKISDFVFDAVGIESKITRFPGGTSNDISKRYSKGIMSRLVPMLLDRGYSFFDWNCDSGDANGTNVPTEKIVQKVIDTAPRGASNINVLMHDTPGKDTTAKALPRIIEYFKDAGYEFLPLTKDSYPVRHATNN